MTTSYSRTRGSGTSSPAGPSTTPLLAALGAGTAAVLTAIGTFVADVSEGAEPHTMSDWLTVLAIIAVATVVVFGLVVRTAAQGDAARRSLVLGVVAILSVVVFWAGLTPVLAAAAVACALQARGRTGRFPTAAAAGTGLAALAFGAVAVLAFVG